MKIFLSSLENGMPLKDSWLQNIKNMPFRMKYNLVSYYYSRRGKALERATFIRDNSELLLVDSGAHSFQKGLKVDWEKYTDEYAEFIKMFDRPNVLGFFEMDIDVIVGYPRVLLLRKKLLKVSDKIIPVWHKDRGIKEFNSMCQEFRGGIVAISGFKNEDIRDEQYLMFLKRAKKYGCKMHCLGMTRRKILDKVPFDFVDSSSWRQRMIFARIGNRKVDSDWMRLKQNRDLVELENYKDGLAMQIEYEDKWRHMK